MSRIIIGTFLLLGIVILIIGSYVGSQFELREALYYNQGNTLQPDIKTIRVYPYVLDGMRIMWIGGIMEIFACIAALILSYPREEEIVLPNTKEKTEE